MVKILRSASFDTGLCRVGGIRAGLYGPRECSKEGIRHPAIIRLRSDVRCPVGLATFRPCLRRPCTRMRRSFAAYYVASKLRRLHPLISYEGIITLTELSCLLTLKANRGNMFAMVIRRTSHHDHA